MQQRPISLDAMRPVRGLSRLPAEAAPKGATLSRFEAHPDEHLDGHRGCEDEKLTLRPTGIRRAPAWMVMGALLVGGTAFGAGCGGVASSSSGAQTGPNATRSQEQTVAAELLRLSAARRTELGLVPLETDEALHKVAQSHSKDMVENAFWGHRSPSHGTPAERLEAAGLRTGLALENIGRGNGAQPIFDSWISSTRDEANLDNPDTSHIGVGVFAQREERRTLYTATQIMARMPSAIELRTAPQRVFEAINRGRQLRGVRPLERDASLSQAAQSAVNAFFADPTIRHNEVVDLASDKVGRFSIAFRRLGGVMALVSSLSEATQLEPTFDPELGYMGIGVAQGRRKDVSANSIAVLVLYAWPR